MSKKKRNEGLRIIMKDSEKALIRLAAAKVELNMSSFSREILINKARDVIQDPSSFFALNASLKTQKHKQERTSRITQELAIEPTAIRA